MKTGHISQNVSLKKIYNKADISELAQILHLLRSVFRFIYFFVEGDMKCFAPIDVLQKALYNIFRMLFKTILS